jgi:hypothetical protein
VTIRGNTIVFRLNVPAKIAMRLSRQTNGHRVSGRCSLKARRGTRCKTFRIVARKTARAGGTTTRITLRKGLLRRGRYRVNATASAGGLSSSFTKTFRRR